MAEDNVQIGEMDIHVEGNLPNCLLQLSAQLCRQLGEQPVDMISALGDAIVISLHVLLHEIPYEKQLEALEVLFGDMRAQLLGQQCATADDSVN